MDVNAPCADKWTPLTAAAFEGHSGVVELLLRSGADANAPDPEGFTALGVAAQKGHREVIECLIRHGTGVDLRAPEGGRALRAAARNGHPDVLELLLHHGADPNAADGDGVTALHVAAQSGHLEVVQRLVNHGADLARRNGSGQTALDIAAAQGHAPIVRLLHDHQAGRAPQVAPQTDLQSLLAELNSLIGLATIKTEVTDLAYSMQFKQLRERERLRNEDETLHMVFTGNPGTGKTTVARLLARIYYSLGILEKGHLVETDRSGLIAEYLGQTAPKVRQAVEQSLGGILFIDEAYSLAESDEHVDPYGREAIAMLLKLMEDHRDDLIVIVAGYPEPMERFIQTNPGMESRFTRYLHFPDYSPDELVAISQRFAAQSDYQLTADALARLRAVFERLYAERDAAFGNARVARNLFEAACRRLARRKLSSGSSLSRQDLITLSAEDIAAPP